MLKIIKRNWLPRTLGALAPWFANFSLKFAQFAVELDLTSYVERVAADNETVQWLLAAREAMDANDRGMTRFRD